MKRKPMGIMDIKRQEMRKAFMSLTPLERVKKMNKVFNDFVALKAKTLGVKEYEVYRKYLKNR